MEEKKLEDSLDLEQKLCIPDYISLREKYKCDKCSLNKRNVISNKRLKYLFSTCDGEPCKRTQCKKRSWFFSDLFSLLTAAIVVIAFICIFSHFQDLLLALAWTIIFVIGMDSICCLFEYVVDNTFENIEKLRRKNYDKKVAEIEALNQEKIKEAEKKKEKEAEVYKDINAAKYLVSSLSNEYFDRLKEVFYKSKMLKEKKQAVLKVYKELLENIESLLEYINLENFYFSEIKVFFQVHLPKLMEYIIIYIESVENDKETEEQLEELRKLLESFNTRVIDIKENLKNSDVEDLIYKMQALRKVVSHINYKVKER